MFYSWAARACAVAAVVCGVLAAVEYFRPESVFQSPPAPEPAWVVTPETVELGDVPVGVHVIGFEVTNPAARPRRVLGVRPDCQGTVCISSKSDDAATVPPGGSFRYECKLTVSAPGPFEVQVGLYLEDGGTRTVTVTARGTGVGE